MLYYFAHPTNMRVQRDVIRMRQREGALGYGVYVMLLEFLRESEDQRIYDDAESIAFALNEQDTKLISRIIHDYSLFELTGDDYIISPFLEKAKKEAESAKAKARENGLKGAKARYNHDNHTHHNPDHTYSVPNSEDSTPIPPPIEGHDYNQNNQPKTPTNVGEKKTTKSKLVGMEWLGISGKTWLETIRGSRLLTEGEIKAIWEFKSETGHNCIMLYDWIRNYNMSKELWSVLTTKTDFWTIENRVFKALHKVVKHVKETQYSPAHPSEYLIYNAINYYNAD